MSNSFKFPRSERLLLPADYAHVFRKNVRVSDQYWTILAATGNNTNSRLGLAIAKKRARRAVDRNRLKRITREFFRVHSDILVQVDLVVMNRDAAASASNEQLRQSLDNLWRKLVIKCKSQ